MFVVVVVDIVVTFSLDIFSMIFVAAEIISVVASVIVVVDFIDDIVVIVAWVS